MLKFFWTLALISATSIIAAEKISVKVIDIQNRKTRYVYVLPMYSNVTSNGRVSCSSNASVVSCSVWGATFALQLPSGRVAVINCEGKITNRLDAMGRILYNSGTVTPTFRSCRVPMVDTLLAEFSGGKAKLWWPVSIDGKKLQSETYKILAVLER